jgi:hypothetical protein
MPVISADVTEEMKERVDEVAGDRPRSAGVREVLRRGLETPRLKERVDRLEEDREEAVERAREAVEEMREVRERWEWERRRIQVLAGLSALSLVLSGAISNPLVETAGTIAAALTIAAVVIVAGGWVDWLTGRREGLEGRTEEPETGTESG